MLLDKDLRILDVNKALVKALPPGLQVDVVGKRIIDLFKGLENTDRFKGYLHALETGEPFHTSPYSVHHPDKELWFDSIVFKMDRGLGIRITDITERVQTEKKLVEAQRNDTIERVSAIVAHDVMNPLKIVAQAAEAMKTRPEHSAKMEEIIRNDTARALEMIEELRENTRNLTLRITPTDLSALLSRAVDEVTPSPYSKSDKR